MWEGGTRVVLLVAGTNLAMLLLEQAHSRCYFIPYSCCNCLAVNYASLHEGLLLCTHVIYSVGAVSRVAPNISHAATVNAPGKLTQTKTLDGQSRGSKDAKIELVKV